MGGLDFDWIPFFKGFLLRVSNHRAAYPSQRSEIFSAGVLPVWCLKRGGHQLWLVAWVRHGELYIYIYITHRTDWGSYRIYIHMYVYTYRYVYTHLYIIVYCIYLICYDLFGYMTKWFKCLYLYSRMPNNNDTTYYHHYTKGGFFTFIVQCYKVLATPNIPQKSLPPMCNQRCWWWTLTWKMVVQTKTNLQKMVSGHPGRLCIYTNHN